MPSGLSAKHCIAEFIGTFLLVFTIGCNVLSRNGAWGAASIGCVSMVSVYAFGSVSGAHFNPAVSVTLALARKLDHLGGWKCVFVYLIPQVLGGLLGSMSYSLLFRGGFALAPKAGHMTGAITCECLYTFMLCFVFLNTAASKAKAGANQYFGLAIGFVLIAGGYGSGAVGAGCFNPAVAISIFASSTYTVSNTSVVPCLCYIGAELVGALLAMIFFGLTRPEERDASDTLKGPRAYGTSGRLLCEFIGTYLLVFTVGLNVLGGSPAAALSIAAVYICMIFAVGDVSGGHFNPAVTVAISIAGRGKGAKELVFYSTVQVVAGMLGAVTYTLVHKGDTFPLGPGVGHDWTAVGVAEVVFTFVLTFVVLAIDKVMATGGREGVRVGSEFGGLIVGAAVIAGGFAVGAVSGACLNPAVSLGVASAHMYNGGFFLKALGYCAFQFVGASLAAVTFRVLFSEDGENDKREEEEL